MSRDGTRLRWLQPSKPDVGDMFLDGQSVVPQRQEGFNTVRVMILRSELFSVDARRVAAWARKYGNGEVMFTNRQNLELRYVPDEHLDVLTQEIEEAGYRMDGHERLPDMVACVGTTQCNLAVSDTPNTYRRLYNEFAADRELWDKVGHLRIHMNGCPNSCAQHWIGDIGLRGTRERNDGGSDEGFGIFVGGSLAGEGHVAEFVRDVTSGQLTPTVKRMLEVYLENRESDVETFGAFSRRIGGAGFDALLGDLPTESVEPVNVRNLNLQSVFARVVREAVAHDQ